jgi:hypothetical protein
VSDKKPQIETTIPMSAMRQIHAAIDLLQQSQFEAAITLAHAAENALPATDKPHLFTKLKATGAQGLNDLPVWLKHGNEYEGAIIQEHDVIEYITRSVSKYIAIYGGLTPRMGAFRDWAIERVHADRTEAQQNDTEKK